MAYRRGDGRRAECNGCRFQDRFVDEDGTKTAECRPPQPLDFPVDLGGQCVTKEPKKKAVA